MNLSNTIVKAVNTMVSEAVTSARLMMGTQGYMAPEIAAAVGGYFVFLHRSESVAIDDFDAAFSASGIYEGTRQ